MRDIALLIAVLAAFVYGYYVMKKVDDYMFEHRRQLAAEKRMSNGTIRIEAENRHMLDSVTSALEYCSDIHPGIQFSIRGGSPKRLLRRLSGRNIDIALLSEETVKGLGKDFVYVPIPAEKQADIRSESAGVFYAVYRENVLSEIRDRVIFYLETEHCRLKCGYCDYID